MSVHLVCRWVPDAVLEGFGSPIPPSQGPLPRQCLVERAVVDALGRHAVRGREQVEHREVRVELLRPRPTESGRAEHKKCIRNEFPFRRNIFTLVCYYACLLHDSLPTSTVLSPRGVAIHGALSSSLEEPKPSHQLKKKTNHCN